MAVRSTEGGKSATSVGKLGKVKQDGKQKKLVTEEKEGGKRVSFRLECGKECEQRMEYLKEEIIKNTNEVIEKTTKGMEEERRKDRERIKELEEKIKGLEKAMVSLEEWVRGEWAKSSEGEEEGNSSSLENRSRNSSVNSGKRYGSEKSWGGISGASGLSMREVEKIKKWVGDKEKEERRCNIVLRGIKKRIPGEVEKEWKKGKEWATNFIKDNIGVECNVVNCRESGNVVVIKLENEKKKKEVMRNKHKLRGGRVFIENDLSWEERKIQAEINKWAKTQREKGIEVKIGIGRVMLKGRWKNWNEILKEKDGREGTNVDGESEGERRDKENIREEREEREGRIGMEKNKKVEEGGREERREERRKEIKADKGTEKNLD